MLTRSRGDFEEILDGSDLVVELMGGLDPARDYVLRAMAAGKHVVTANKQLLSQHGEELWAAARENGVQLRFEAAVAGVVPGHPRPAGVAGRPPTSTACTGSSTGRRTSSSRAWPRPAPPTTTRWPRPSALGYAEADPTEDVNGKDAAAKMAILARLAFDTPVHLDQVPYEGIEHITADDMEYARELGLGLKLIGTAERVDGGLSVRVHPAFLYGGHPLASVSGPFNAVTIESQAITEITLSGPGAGGPQTASAVLGDVISAMIPPASTPETTDRLPIVSDVESAFYLHLEVADRPGVLAQVAQLLGLQGASIRSVVQKGLGRERAPGDGHPPDPRVAASTPRWSSSAAWTSCAPGRARSGSSTRSSCRADDRPHRALPRPPAVRRGRPRRLAAARARRRSSTRRASASRPASRCG